jgi:dipeptidyl aminopeptidase/acylaminoacyl peptidase
MVTQTNRFRAAAAGAPAVNMIAAYDGIRWGTGLPRQFQYEGTQSRIAGSIWQYPTRLTESSPIFWVDRVQTPVMILQNDADDAVPWYQGIEFFLSLRRLGKEAYLFHYNGQPHGLRNRADQKDYTIRLQQYFDHYLKCARAPHWMEKEVPYLERDKTALSELGGQ